MHFTSSVGDRGDKSAPFSPSHAVLHVKMLVQVKYSQQQKYVKLDEDEGRFDFMQFHENVIERFCLPPDAKVIYKDATGTEVDAEIFSDLVGQGNVVLTLFSDQEFSDFSLSSASETSDSSFSSSASTIILDDVPSKRQRIEDTHDAVSAEQLIEAVLRVKSGGEEVLQEYQTTETLTDAARRKMVNILVAYMIDNHGNTSMMLQAAQDTFLASENSPEEDSSRICTATK
ncbi:uncharacterized protein LOC115195869 isoform X2 [Salmo trutta]|uniref:uncharacterized protein LOC115195869 isoform X2 n=1 Tax=Salmo trutta TaxID=8032 RepID=UPI0011321109|nr:uncharacterized protein LOC115195869 isoform X2 [Salmo trutta]